VLKTFRAVLENFCPIMLDILESLKIFNSTPKNVGHSRKILMIPKEKKQLGSSKIFKIPINNFGQIIKKRFHCCPKSQATWKNCSKVF
jgi:hypothetical protein